MYIFRKPRASDEMEMNVWDLLSTVFPHTKKEFIPFFGNIQVPGDIPRD